MDCVPARTPWLYKYVEISMLPSFWCYFLKLNSLFWELLSKHKNCYTFPNPQLQNLAERTNVPYVNNKLNTMGWVDPWQRQTVNNMAWLKLIWPRIVGSVAAADAGQYVVDIHSEYEWWWTTDPISSRYFPNVDLVAHCQSYLIRKGSMCGSVTALTMGS